MQKMEMQIAYAVAGFYHGAIDGDFGAQSRAAMVAAETKYAYVLRATDIKRRRIASVQACLNGLGYEAGLIDGYEGHNTRNALDALLYKIATGKVERVDRVKKPIQPKASSDIPYQSDVQAYYGDPENQVPHRLKTIILPFKYRIDYNLAQHTNKVTVHELAASSLEAALLAVYDHYGPARMRELGLDRYAGAYNKRRMRGGDAWSMHAFACAIDFYARPNGLRTRCPKALFCGPDYKDFLDIMEANEWLSAIRLWGADAMHFQRAKL